MPATTEVAVKWDLSALFQSPEDPKIESTWAELNEAADQFATRYRGKINTDSLTPETLFSSLAEMESMSQTASKPIGYASLIFAADSGNPALGAFMAKQMEAATTLSVKTLFYELELQAAPESAIERCLKDPRLAKYRHFVNHSRLYSRYRLTEAEETILEETANTGCRAWERLFEEITSNHLFNFDNPETHETEKLSQEEVISKLREPNREVRVAASHALAGGLKEMERVLVFTFNNLLQDKAVDDRLRSFEYPEQGRHLSNELTPEVVDQVIDLCQERYDMVERFYKIKQQILGLPELTHVDRYAPLFEAEQTVTFEEGKTLVLEAFGGFSLEMKDRAAEFFEKSWIDAEPRTGKRGGAFCAYNTPDTHPVVFLSYLNKSDDVMTLAHELGHGVHASLSRAQSYFNFHGTLPLAECASTFGEMLVFEKLVGKAPLKDQLALYAEKLEGIFATIFRQSAMYRFEKRIHRARRNEGELTAEQFGEIWQEELQAMFGESVKLGDDHKCFWSYIPHFIGSPFYVYAYSFGELVVLSLFDMARAEGPSFAPRYLQMLEKGGSETPHELMAALGVDLSDRAFWQGGFAAMERLLNRFEEIWKELQPTWKSS